jgi:hypothetical protein
MGMRVTAIHSFGCADPLGPEHPRLRIDNLLDMPRTVGGWLSGVERTREERA